MGTLNQVMRLARVCLLPEGMKAFLTWRPFSITGYNIVRLMCREGFRFGTIIDGGANIGQFARAAHHFYPAARLICFEPLPAAVKRLRFNVAHLIDAQIIEAALGRTQGRAVLHRNRVSVASSLLRLDPDSKNVFPELGEIDSIEVPMVTLDSALAGTMLPRPTLVKLDLQGYELEALKGGGHTLQRTDFVLLETALKPVYVGAPTFNDVSEHLRAHGFRFLRTVDTLVDSRGEEVQRDVLFGRVEENSVWLSSAELQRAR